MSTLTELVAAVVLHSSSAALSHFGVAAPPAQVEHTPPAPQRTVARSHPRSEKAAQNCPPGTQASLPSRA